MILDQTPFYAESVSRWGIRASGSTAALNSESPSDGTDKTDESDVLVPYWTLLPATG